jgi:uncharacterized protein
VEIGLIAPLLALGAITGFLAGLLGIGGGMIMVPFLGMVLKANGVPVDQIVKVSIATSLATILFTSISSVWSHHHRGTVRWDLVALLAPGIVIGSLVAAQFAAVAKDSWMAIFFGLFVGYMALQMLRPKSKTASTTTPKTLPPNYQLTGVGAAIGGLSSLVGAGGGFMTVPYLAARGISLPQAIASSAACGFPIALAGTIGYIYSGWDLTIAPGAIGFIYLPALIVVSIASMAIAPLGVKVAATAPTATLKKLFGGMLFCIATYMLWKGLSPYFV